MTDSVTAQVHGHKACAGCRIVTASTALLSRDSGRRPAAGRVKLSLITATSVHAPALLQRYEGGAAVICFRPVRKSETQQRLLQVQGTDESGLGRPVVPP